MASDPVFRVNGKEYPVPTDFTLGEMADMERYFGVDFNEPGQKVSKLTATLWIAIRRVDDSVTLEDVRALPPDAFEQKGGDARPPDETSGSAPPGSNALTSESSSSGSDASADDPPPSGGHTSAATTGSVLETSLT